MKRESVAIQRDNIRTPRADAFSERVRQNFIALANYFEQDESLRVPVAQVLRDGLVITPKKNLIHSYASRNEEGRALIELSKVGQMSDDIGDHTQLHEGGHIFSHTRSRERLARLLFSDGKEGVTSHLVHKSGFHYRVGWTHKSMQHYFSGLNEALTDSIPLEILKTRNWSLIYRHFLYIYRRERNMLATIIASVAQSFGEGSQEEREGAVFRLLVKSYVLGWQPELKSELLRVFGPNALRVLAIVNAPGYVKAQHGAVTLYPRKWWKVWEKHYYKEALTFFDMSKSEVERDAAARAILPGKGPVHFVERKRTE